MQGPERVNNKASELQVNEPIAIIGIGCRLPGGVSSPHDYWQLLINGIDAVEEVPANRWDPFKFYDAEPGRPGKIITKWGGFLREVDQFDPEFFGISPREAASMDPQQRLVLESAWEALEDAGQQSEQLAGKDVGVFVGVSTFDYGLMQNTYSDVSVAGPYTNTGQALSICANRLSFLMDWKGPSLIVDTACSSSLLACHMAIHSIWRGESSMAIVSGVNFICSPSTYMGFTAMGMLSPDGRCKAFDASANGFVRSEGGCSVFLKPLKDAIRDEDPIYAVIKGSASNQDGHTPGMTMPSQSSQEVLIQDACLRAQIDPGQVRYVEAHGTGTPVGDPIEINAIGRTIGKYHGSAAPCFVGSVKTNIGHLEAGSGIAGLIKTCLILKHQQIPPNLHFNHPNDNIDFEGLNLQVPTEMTPLPTGKASTCAGINSFGFGGTNVHLILQEYREPSQSNSTCHGTKGKKNVAEEVNGEFVNDSASSSLFPNKVTLTTGSTEGQGIADTRCMKVPFPISAQSPDSLRSMAQSYLQALKEGGIWKDVDFADILYTVAFRRSHHRYRATLLASDKKQLETELEKLGQDEESSWLELNPNQPAVEHPIAFVFAGQGPQWWAMGRELLEQEPVFRQVLEKCDLLIQQLGSWSLIEELTRDEESSRINDTQFAQPAIFAVQVGLFELWKSWGIQPGIVVGHSIGEIAAAYAAGVLSFEDATKVIFHRGRSMGQVHGDGAMLAVAMSPDEALEFIKPWEGKIGLAAINGPHSITLSGDTPVIEQVEELLNEKELFVRRLQVNYAFHSHQMDPVQSDLVTSLADIQPRPAQIPWISTVTGQTVEGSEITAEYWWKNVRCSVQFCNAIKRVMERVMDREHQLFLEIGPHPVLSGSIGECYLANQKRAIVATSLHRGEPEREQLLRSLGKLYANHCSIDWTAFVDHGKFVGLPGYPWNKQSYWSETMDSQFFRLACQGHPILGARIPGSRLVFQGFMDIRKQPFIADHKIQGHVLMPGTGFLEAGVALGNEVYGEGNFVVADLELLKPTFLDDKETLLTETFLDKRTGEFSVETQPLGQPNRPWTVHCVGILRERKPEAAEKIPDLREVRNRCNHNIPPHNFYEFFRRCGFPFGPTFRGLSQIQLGKGEMLGCIEVPEECDDFEQYNFHPAVLDACLQGNFGCFMTHNLDIYNLGDLEKRTRKSEIFMPSGYGEFRLYRKPLRRMWSYVRMNERNRDLSDSDIFVFDDEGELIAEVRGYKETLVGTVEGTAQSDSGMLYEYSWHAQNHPDAPENRFQLPSLDEIELPASIANRNDSLLADCHEEQTYRKHLRDHCLRIIVDSFQTLGLPDQLDGQKTLADLLQTLEIDPWQLSLADHLLKVLHHAGVIREVQVDESLQLRLDLPQSAESLLEVFWKYPQWYAQTAWVAHCGARLTDILRGTMDVSQLGVVAGEFIDLIPSLSPANQALESQLAETVASFFENIRPDETARILDVRGGSGRMAKVVLDNLPADQVDFVFTDHNEASFSFAKETLAPYSNVRFEVWNPESADESNIANLSANEMIIARSASPGFSNWNSQREKLEELLLPGGIMVWIETDALEPVEALTEHLASPSIQAGGFNLAEAATQFATSGWKTIQLESDPGNRFAVLITQRPYETAGINQAADYPGRQLESLTRENESDSQPDQEDPKPETWLVFTNQSGVEGHFKRLIKDAVIQIVSVYQGPEFERTDKYQFTINADSEKDWLQLLHALDGRKPDRVFYFWGLDRLALDSDSDAILDCGHYEIALPVQFCQAWLKTFGSAPTKLWMFTQNAFAIEASDVADPHQWPLLGTGRVIMNELPQFHCRLVDLGSDLPLELESLWLELQSELPEDELAFRGQTRYVHRFAGSSIEEYADRGEQPEQPYHLQLCEYGTLDGMRLRPAKLKESIDLPTVVEVEVHVAALNFSDVMKALGLYPGLAEGFVPVGIECAGVVTRVGEEVQEFKPGDEVVCISPMSISSHTYTDQRFVAHKPKHLSMAEAATLPITFLTAHYALNHVGQIDQGEKILINAATGGVGLAAIQLANAVDAELFATAGTDLKRSLLKFLGVPHVMNSRSLTFADQIMELTGQQGIDVILNSLSGEAIEKGISILSGFGRFLEIGKRDIYANSKLGLRAFRKNILLAAIDLDSGLREKPNLFSKMFRQIIQDAVNGKIKPLPHQVFPVGKLVDAFRYMANAKHIGKVLVKMKDQSVRPVRNPSETTIRFRSDACYLLTGGLGGLGLALAQWMANQGAKCLILVSRGGVQSKAAEEVVAKLRKQGIQVLIENADLSDQQQVQDLIRRIQSDLPPLRGIMHAAAVLDDGLIMNQTRSSIDRVCGPKMRGAWYLHQATLDIELDFFVSHSSISAVFGSAGQANYSAANAFLDGLTAYRRTLGLPALSVNWGYMGDLGLAAGNKKLASIFEQQGIKPVPPREGLPILGRLMSFDVENISVVRADWTKLRQVARTMAKSPRFEQMMASEGNEDGSGRAGSDVRKLILSTPINKRADVMLGIVRDKIARVLGVRPEKVDIERSLMDLGLDSLMGFEMRNWIEGELRINIPVAALMKGPTVQKLTDLILAQLQQDNPDEQAIDETTDTDLLTEHMQRFQSDPQQLAAFAALVSSAQEIKFELHGNDENVDLASEVRLPDDLQASVEKMSKQEFTPSRPKHIFLTGGTGFLGAYILHHLLITDSGLRITCLVRASAENEAEDRIRENLEHYQLWKPEFSERIEVLIGDVTHEKFGLDEQSYLQLAAKVDLVLQNAAGVNFLQGYDQLKPINVAGTENAMRLATCQKLKPYHHVSTLYVFSVLDHLEQSTIRETDSPNRFEFIYGGYLRSKWVADHLVQRARDLGLPATIHRPGIITGDSKNGICSNDVISRSLVSGVQLGCCPADAMQFTLTPVDYVGQAIASLVLQTESLGKNFHLVNEKFIDWTTATGWLANMGHRIELLPYSEWLDRLKEDSQESADNILSGLLPLIPQVRLSGQSLDFPAPRFDCSQANELLSKDKIVCPEISEQLFRTCLQHLTKDLKSRTPRPGTTVSNP